MEKIYVAVGQKIAKIRKNLCYTQEKLAELSGLHRNYIGYVERGERRVSLANLEKIANSLNVQIKELFNDM